MPAASPYGTDCPIGAPSPIPPSSPRILILGPGPSNTDAISIAAHLQAILAADAAFTTPEVVGLTTSAINPDAELSGGISLMNFFYLSWHRDERLARLAEPWSYVVLLETTGLATTYPEFYFEAVRILGCTARAAGAKPIVLMTWSTAHDMDLRAEVTYRVANGTDSIVAPAGYAWDAVVPAWGVPDSENFMAAASLYSTLTGKNALDPANTLRGSHRTSPRS